MGAISSTYDFEAEFRQAVNVDAGVPGIFEFSASASYSEIVRATQSRKQTFVFARAYRETHGRQGDLTGEHLQVELTANLKGAVAALPRRARVVGCSRWRAAASSALSGCPTPLRCDSPRSPRYRWWTMRGGVERPSSAATTCVETYPTRLEDGIVSIGIGLPCT